jgi:uncharacterized protein YlxW (UPF0749 family)
MLVFGLLLTTQFRLQKQVPADPSRLRASDLAAEVKNLQEKLREVEKERDRLAAENERLKKGEGIPLPDTTPLEMLAGTIEVQGPGVIVELQTVPGKGPILDRDLWQVVNELLAAGAEGIAVNGQRLTALSGIRTVDQRTLIYKTMTAAPYEIAAIGDPQVLESALRLRAGVVDQLNRYGIQVTIVRSDKIKLPAFRPVPNFLYARPVK